MRNKHTKELKKLKKELNLLPSQQAVLDFFIENLLKEQREELVKEIEGKKTDVTKPVFSEEAISFIAQSTHNQALDDIIQIIKDKQHE